MKWITFWILVTQQQNNCFKRGTIWQPLLIISNKLVRELVQELRTEALQHKFLRKLRRAVCVRELGGFYLRSLIKGRKVVKSKVVSACLVRVTDSFAEWAFI